MDMINYQPYFDPEIESLIERIHPPRVCIDNEACQDCTVVKVDSANKHGILLDMVQVLTDLDLVISKSYISSDGGWFMDVFHVTDQLGNKLTDESLIIHMQQALCASRARGISNKSPSHASTNHTALEMTGMDQPGMMSEMVAVLEELGCHVTGAVAWAHNSRVACIIYLEDGFKGGPITDPARLAQVQDQLENVVEAHHEKGGRRCVRLIAHCPPPSSGKTHTERRLHQLMYTDGDYEQCFGCDYNECRRPRGCVKTHVLVEICSQKGYSIVNVRSRDRPKLLFDTVCALTEMQYVVFHAAVGSHGPIADQEYFIRRKDGRSLISESERVSLTQCLIGAIERRVSQGLRLEVCAKDRTGLLSDVTRVFRENGLSILGVEMGRRGENMIGSFNVTDSSGINHDVNLVAVEVVRKEIGGSVLVGVNKSSPNNLSKNSSAGRGLSSRGSRNSSSDDVEERTKFSLGSLLWSHLERLSGNFSPIRS